MLNVFTEKPSPELGYITASYHSGVSNNVIEIPSIVGLMDPSITVAGLRNIYLESKKSGLPMYIPANLSFQGKLREFVKAILFDKKNTTFNLYTKNIELLSIINEELAAVSEVKKVLVIDTHNFYHRTYHSLPVMNDSSGRTTTLLKALSSLFKWILAQDYSHVIFASEGSNSKRISYTRAKLGEAGTYKGTRSETAPALKEQIAFCDQILTDIGFAPLRYEGYEADDVMSSVAHEVSVRYDNKVEVHGFTGDKDLCQLYTYPSFRIVDVKSKEVMGEEYLINKFGVTPDKFLDYQALVGDNSDNVAGLKGVAGVKAIGLLDKFGTLENIIANISEIDKPAIKKAFEEGGVESVMISKDLVFMRRHLFSEENLSKYALKYYDFNSMFKEKLAQYDINY